MNKLKVGGSLAARTSEQTGRCQFKGDSLDGVGLVGVPQRLESTARAAQPLGCLKVAGTLY
jgi:hypothetical protein